MNKQRKAMRARLKAIKTVSEYKEVTADLKLTDTEREIMDMIYLKGYDYGYIADTLGFSYSHVAKVALKIIDKF